MSKIFIIIFLLIIYNCVSAQEQYSVDGYIRDSITKEPLVGASLVIEPLQRGLTVDKNGHFTILLKRGEYTFTVSYIGYKKLSKTVFVNNNMHIDILLNTQSVSVGDVNISAKNVSGNLNRTGSMLELSSKQINKLPSLMGKPDILSAIKLTPGIQAGGEGNTGIYVRGGDAGQNLILLGDIPLYNPSHLLGFFPLFNSDIVRDVTVFKGALPVQYGGRLSSIIDISMKESNSEGFAGSGSIGMLASDLTLETPFANNRGSIVISGRQTYMGIAGIIISPIVKSTKSYFENNDYRFFDSSIKLRYSITPKTRLILTGFGSKDNYCMNDDEYNISNTLKWNNFGAAIKLSHYFSDRFIMSGIVSRTLYNYDMYANFNEFNFDLYSGIDDWKYTLKFNLFTNDFLSFKFGASYTSHILTPNRVNISANSVNYSNVNNLYSDEASAYISTDMHLSKKIKLTAGIRQTYYRHRGPYIEYITDNIGQINDSITYDRGEKVKDYLNFDPSISINYSINNISSFKGSISTAHQYIQLVSVGAVSLPTDFWLPTTDYIEPQKVSQASAGYYHNFIDNILETSIEVYYKYLENQIDFKNGVLDNFDNKKIRDNIVTGTGQAYGIEFFIKKTVGSTGGWLSYTLSRTFREYDELNGGKPFPAKYDRIHDFSATLNHKFNKKWSCSAVFVYSTGSAITLPVGRYVIQGKVANDYSEINSYRMPDYHRLDISVDYHFKKRGKVDSWINFSVYNVYNRANPFYIYFQAEGNLDEYYLKVTPNKITLYPILPSFTWRFKF